MAQKKKLTPEQEKEIKLLQANNEMLAKTKEEARAHGNDGAVKQIEEAQQDVFKQMAKISENIANAAKKVNEENEKKMVTEAKTEENQIKVEVKETPKEKTVFEKIKEAKTKNVTIMEEATSDEAKEEEPQPKLKINEKVFDTIPSDVQYDIIALPSNGEGYKSKIGRIPVGYLTAYDENFLTSPNLYQDGLVIDFLLKNKILDKDFNIDEMYNGDADAVILFLRATSYGAEFPISVKDPDSGKRFDTMVDLTTFKSKQFELHGDENGYFDYTLPLSKDEIKFKFLTRQEEKDLRLIAQIERVNGRAMIIRQALEMLKTALNEESTLGDTETDSIKKSIKEMNDWADRIDKDKTVSISKLITNRLEMNIVAVNGETDKEFIAEYIKKMKVRDAFALRKYITQNEPGIDWSFKCERPASLGGGSFETFLNWDDNVFFNISEG